jgi:DNA-binding MarR family transcriptional regulator
VNETNADIDRLIHEPARLTLVANLYVVDSADFTYLSRRTGLTDGNISSHMTRLEDAGYVSVTKTFEGKRPRTLYELTTTGRKAFDRYRSHITGILDTNTSTT